MSQSLYFSRFASFDGSLLLDFVAVTLSSSFIVHLMKSDFAP